MEIEQCADYADICNMRDDTNEFYQSEIDYWNKFKPKFDLLFTNIYQICIETPFKEELKYVIPDNFFNSIEYTSKINSEKILDLKKKDSDLKIAYRKLLNKKCKFRGGEYNLSYVASFFSSPNRTERKEAHDAYNNFFIDNKNELDSIFYEMIKIRNEMS